MLGHCQNCTKSGSGSGQDQAHAAGQPQGAVGCGLGEASSDSDSSREACLLYTSPSPRDLSTSRMPSSA